MIDQILLIFLGAGKYAQVAQAYVLQPGGFRPFHPRFQRDRQGRLKIKIQSILLILSNIKLQTYVVYRRCQLCNRYHLYKGMADFIQKYKMDLFSLAFFIFAQGL
jgi:hypothetical protein